MKAENPFTREYWLGDVDPRPLALFRILFGSVLLFDLLQGLPNVGFLFSDEGWLPRQAIPKLSRTWSLFRLVGSPSATLALYCLGVLAVVALVLGFRTRIASIATFVFIASLHSRDPFIVTGPDRVIAVMSFWMMLADMGGAWSLDRRAGRRAGTTVAATGLRFLQWQMCLIYLFAAIAKRGPWGAGLGIFHIMQVQDFATPIGAWLVQWPSLSIALNWLVIATELGVPLLLIPLAPVAPRWTRAAGIAAALALFIGIILTVYVGNFPELMIAALALFVPAEWLDRLGAEGRTPVAPARPTSPVGRRVLLGAGVLQLALVFWSLLAFHFHLPQERLIRREVHQLDLFQAWNMFAQRDRPINSWWTDVGLLANGDHVEVLQSLASKIVNPEVPDSHWEAIRMQMMSPISRQDRSLFGQHICRTFNRSAPVPLRELELTLHEQPVRDPGEPLRPVHVGAVYRLPCD